MKLKQSFSGQLRLIVNRLFRKEEYNQTKDTKSIENIQFSLT